MKSSLNIQRVKALQGIIEQSPEVRLNKAALTIQLGLYYRMRRKRDAKELREQLKKLPMVCRSGFVKMITLKANTTQLQTDVSALAQKL